MDLFPTGFIVNVEKTGFAASPLNQAGGVNAYMVILLKFY